jgi:hypothetical protein
MELCGRMRQKWGAGGMVEATNDNEIGYRP